MNSTTFLVTLLFHVVVLITSNQYMRDKQKGYLLQVNEGKIDQLVNVTWARRNKTTIIACELTDDVDSIREALKDRTTRNSRLNQTWFQNVLESCEETTRRPKNEVPSATTEKGESTTDGDNGWHLHFPGTEWCGTGEKAVDDNDLGYFSDTDNCCRTHGKCNDKMDSGETKYNLTNTSPFTKLSCKCEDDFYDCLNRVNSVISNKIGNIYFNIARNECYELEYPETKNCKTHRTFLNIMCKEYERNTTAPKTYQWRKPKLYKKLPVPGPLTINIPFV